jgi:pyruvate/2-oxoglutarate dehydrogenase complex dihydrolipoamide acyltransferase (E2) component
MPKLGEIMQEAEITKWLKAEGDGVNQGESVVEVMTEKVNVDLEAPSTGVVLKIYAPEGKMVAAAEPLCAIGLKGEVPPDAKPSTSPAP